MDNNFQEQFVKSIEASSPNLPQATPHDSKKPPTVIIILCITVLIEAVIIVIMSINLLSISNSISNNAEFDSEEIVEDEEASRQYNDSGELIAINMSCSNGVIQYDFFLDNEYYIESVDTQQVTGSGSYSMLNTEVIMNPDSSDASTLTYTDGKLQKAGEGDFSCEEYNS